MQHSNKINNSNEAFLKIKLKAKIIRLPINKILGTKLSIIT